jgi:hypothetical protein
MLAQIAFRAGNKIMWTVIFLSVLLEKGVRRKSQLKGRSVAGTRRNSQSL